MFSAILAAIAAIPEILKSIRQLIAYFEKMDKAGFFEANTKAMQDISASKTEEESKAAAKELSDVLKKL